MVPIKVFLISLFLCFLLTLILGYLLFDSSVPKKVLSHLVEWFAYWLQRFWYAIIFIGTTIFVVVNFDKCIELTFTKDFSGYNVVLLFWLLLMILPLFERFEGFGINLKWKHQSTEASKIAMEAMDTSKIMTVEALNELNKKDKEEEDGNK